MTVKHQHEPRRHGQVLVAAGWHRGPGAGGGAGRDSTRCSEGWGPRGHAAQSGPRGPQQAAHLPAVLPRPAGDPRAPTWQAGEGLSPTPREAPVVPRQWLPMTWGQGPDRGLSDVRSASSLCHFYPPSFSITACCVN